MYYYIHADPYKQGHPVEYTMAQERLDRLKAVLSQPSYTENEGMVVDYVVNFCNEHGFNHIVDEKRNVLITKGEVKEGEFYPLVGAHTDTVHKAEPKIIKEHLGILTAHDPTGHQIGIGGDDLAGVAVCLELLLTQPVIKVGLFIGEEHGCIGSRHACKNNQKFFENVGYFIEFDGPEDYMITEVCSGITLFERKSEFFKKSLPLLHESMGDKMRFFSHPFTDVSIVKQYFDFCCINISAGYFNWHSHAEYVVIEEVEKAVKLGEKMIAELSLQKYQLTYRDKWAEKYKNGKWIYRDPDENENLLS